MNRDLIGREYVAEPVQIEAAHLSRYDDTTQSRRSPVYPVSFVKDLFLAVFHDKDFDGDAGRMVHAGQEFRYHGAWEAGDVISRRARILSIDEKATGELVTLRQELLRDDRPLVEMTSRMFFRGKEKEGKPGAEKPESQDGGRTESVEVAGDLPLRYAEASGDNNPIHVSPEFAKSVGFRGVILQGLCTLALAVRTLPPDMRSLAVRFVKPVYPGDTITTRIRENGKSISFETDNQDGVRVLSGGQCTIS